MIFILLIVHNLDSTLTVLPFHLYHTSPFLLSTFKEALYVKRSSICKRLHTRTTVIKYLVIDNPTTDNVAVVAKVIGFVEVDSLVSGL